jgi:tetratricopeptide (TPR) repeat protein
MKALLIGLLLTCLCACNEEPSLVVPFDPRGAEASLPDVMAALRAGDPGAALSELDRLEALGQLPEGALHYRALALADAGRHDESLVVWQDELAAHPGNGYAHAFAAERLLERGLLDEAGSHIDAAHRFAPDLPLLALITGRHALLTEQDELAARAFSAFLAVDPYGPNAAEAHHGLAQIAARRGDPSASVHAERSEYLEQVHRYLALARSELAADPDNLTERFRVASIYLSLFQELGSKDMQLLERAEAALEAVFELDPEYARALFNMGFVRTVQGRQDEAESFFRQTLVQDIEHTGARLNLARLLMRFRDDPGDEPHMLIEEVLALSEDPAELAQAHALLADRSEQAGDVDAAIQHYEAILELFPEDSAGVTERLASLRGPADG